MKHSDEVYRWVAEENCLRLAEYLRPGYSVGESASEIQRLTGLRFAFVHDLIAWSYYDTEASEQEKLATISGWNAQEKIFLETVRNIQSGEEES
ncbi:hypothetical protein [Deinococcus altitudinis]|uniref:hypothetical protein n=1 Tax=Deinococcus altitudinis TaxID=468914 RepID=UPI0038920603